MVLCVSLLVFSCILDGSASYAQESERLSSAYGGVAYLARVMDEFHDRFPVYDDVSSPGNHFHAFGKIPDQFAAADVNGSWTDRPHSGATAIRFAFGDTPGPNFAGFYLLNGVLGPDDRAPTVNFGSVPAAGIDLTGATGLTFWARGESGGESIEFFMGGVGRDAATGSPVEPFPGSSPVAKISVVLDSEWQSYRIDLQGRNLSYVLGGFGWVADDAGNPGGAVFFVDDIQYELTAERQLARLNEPRFLRSFSTAPVQESPEPVGDFDRVLRNTAFTYDNALALLAFLAVGTSDGLRRARLLGDAFVYASQNDRHYVDGRLRDAYAAGDLVLPPGWMPNGRLGTVPVSGFFSEETQEFVEIEQGGVSVGNDAWAMVALLALYRRTAEATYLDAARRLGDFIRTFRNDHGAFQGFQGGFDDPETASPQLRPWASTEHNLDVLAAFEAMSAITGETVWRNDAAHARSFVEAMWDNDRQCFLAGTLDPERRNLAAGQLPLDTQSWSLLAIPDLQLRFPEVLDCAEQFHHLSADGVTGFDFNEDRDGVWFEGTAQMALAHGQFGTRQRAETLTAELRRAQATVPFGDGEGITAASHDGVSTGFGFVLFRRLHIAATAWHVFAQLNVNPYRLPWRCGDADADGAVAETDGIQALREAARLSSSCSPVVCDLSGNQRVDTVDAVRIFRVAAGLAIGAECALTPGVAE